MITRIRGKLIEKNDQAVIVENNNIFYEITVPTSVLNRLNEVSDAAGNVELIIYYYFQINPTGGGVPVLIGFINEVERDFFLQFIKVSGIGPKAAVKAIDKPISQISQAIDNGDMAFLKTLPGIGMQRAKEIIAKLQGKVGKYGLIQDRKVSAVTATASTSSSLQEEALAVLLQLQYKRAEALDMIDKALKRMPQMTTTEELLNEIYKQRTKA